MLRKYTMPLLGIQRPILTSLVARTLLKASNENCLLDINLRFFCFSSFRNSLIQHGDNAHSHYLTLCSALFHNEFCFQLAKLLLLKKYPVPKLSAAEPGAYFRVLDFKSSSLPTETRCARKQTHRLLPLLSNRTLTPEEPL